MDENQGAGNFQTEEAISAVVDDGLLDEDYEDLYNDVNVGENFLNSMRTKNDVKVTHPPSHDAFYSNKNHVEVSKGLGLELGQPSPNLVIENVPNNSNTNTNNNKIPQQMIYQQPPPPPPPRMDNVNGGNANNGGTMLYVGDLHWWTTDAELESELCKYGQVKEVKFFDERASGKSKGYCQVEFYDPMAASACKEGMNGHVFNGRPCVVAFASPLTVKRMGEAQFNRTQQQMGQVGGNQPRKGPVDVPSKPVGNVGVGGNNNNNQGGFDNNGRGGFGRGNWGRGNNQGNRGPMGGRGGRGFPGNGFGQGPPLMHPQNMMGQGFDPAFGGPMGRMGGYGGFPGAPNAPFPGMVPPFGPGMGNVGMPGVAPHVNPAFFGRGMPMNSMGMMHGPGIEGPNMGMWGPDPNMGGWAGDEHGAREREPSYGEDAASDHNYGEGGQEKRQLADAIMEKDRESGSSERKYQDERGVGYDRDAPRGKDIGRDHDWSEKKHRGDRDGGRQRERERDRGRSRDRDRERERNRDDRDRYNEHRRHRSREGEYDDERDRGRSSRTHGKSRLPHEEDQRSRSRDADYGKRRRLTSD